MVAQMSAPTTPGPPASADAGAGGTPMHDFPPMYTRQVNAETWQKQRQLWCDLILEHCRERAIHTLDLNEALSGPLFNNTRIQRRVSLELAREFIQQLVSQGNAQWEGDKHARCLIIWRTAEQWASLIDAWVQKRGMNNTVVTLYELRHGEDSEGEAFHELEETMLLRALEALQKRGKAQIFQVDSETGVKFF